MIITIQPEQVRDGVASDGTPLYRLPYPFHIDAGSGEVQRQDFWRGDPEKIIGFQVDADRQQVDLWWDDVAVDPLKAVGKFPVFTSRRGGIWTYRVAIETVIGTEES